MCKISQRRRCTYDTLCVCLSLRFERRRFCTQNFGIINGRILIEKLARKCGLKIVELEGQ